jgi:Flp pilus assembly pilin Flp
MIMKNFLKQLWKEDQGQDLVEYSLLLALIALAAIASIGTISQSISDIFSSAAVNISSASS